MKYNEFHGEKLSALGFGCMRFPVLEDGKTIDEALVENMFDLAIKNGINYFDTAWPYHDGNSEIVTGKILKKYPRDSFYLATKYPGHQLVFPEKRKEYAPNVIFEKQLEKAGVDYFDFYLLHNVNEGSIGPFEDEELGVIKYFREQVKNGRIKHLGFSSHAQLSTLKGFLDRHPDTFEFCQIQLNYMDWTLQSAKEKYEYITSKGLGVWVMEGIRGGKLATLPEECETKLRVLRPDETDAAWAIRWVQTLPNVVVQLSGMSNLEQVEDNIKTMTTGSPLSEDEFNLLLELASKHLMNAIPCTKCRYCCEGCPQELDIPDLIAVYNDLCSNSGPTAMGYINSLPEDKRPSACVACGKCKKICPQGIDVPTVMKDFTERLDAMKKRMAARK